MDNFTEQMLRYVDGLSVSKEFLEEIKHNKNLIKNITELKSDLEIILNMKDSKLTNHIINKNKSRYMIIKMVQKAIEQFSYEVEDILGFSNVALEAERNIDKSTQKSVYLYECIEVVVLEKTILLKIKSIKNKCEIVHDGKTILNISNRKYLELELKKGDYIITIDEYKANIFIK